jgi:hypothetical protein
MSDINCIYHVTCFHTYWSPSPISLHFHSTSVLFVVHWGRHSDPTKHQYLCMQTKCTMLVDCPCNTTSRCQMSNQCQSRPQKQEVECWPGRRSIILWGCNLSGPITCMWHSTFYHCQLHPWLPMGCLQLCQFTSVLSSYPDVSLHK